MPFDVPFLDGHDLRDLPLLERKQILRRIVPRQDSRLLYVSHIEAHGIELFTEVCRRDLEGIVAKWKHGTYVSGDQTSWVKIRNPAYSQAIGRWERFERKPQGRVYAARAVSGLAP
jgi:ATP-dependent DNA ligase